MSMEEEGSDEVGIRVEGEELLEDLGNRIGPEPLAHALALGDAHLGDVVEREGPVLLVREEPEDARVDGVCPLRLPAPVPAQLESTQGLGEEHLAAAEHAAPALVALRPRPASRSA